MIHVIATSARRFLLVGAALAVHDEGALELQAECFAEVYARRREAQRAEKERRGKPWGHGVVGQDVARAESQSRRARTIVREANIAESLAGWRAGPRSSCTRKRSIG